MYSFDIKFQDKAILNQVNLSCLFFSGRFDAIQNC